MTRQEIELVEQLMEACWKRDEPAALKLMMVLLKNELDATVAHFREIAAERP